MILRDCTGQVGRPAGFAYLVCIPYTFFPLGKRNSCGSHTHQKFEQSRQLALPRPCDVGVAGEGRERIDLVFFSKQRNGLAADITCSGNAPLIAPSTIASAPMRNVAALSGAKGALAHRKHSIHEIPSIAFCRLTVCFDFGAREGRAVRDRAALPPPTHRFEVTRWRRFLVR